MGYNYIKKPQRISDTDIRKYNGTVVSGSFMPYRKSYKEKVISRINKMLNIILSLLILVSVVSYYIVTSSEMKLNKIRKETLTINDENLELQNHLDYLKSYTNVNERMKNSNLVQKAEEVVEVSAKNTETAVEKKKGKKELFVRNTETKTDSNGKKETALKWSLGY